MVESKSPSWQRCDLRMTRLKEPDRGQLLIFKELEWQTVRIEARSTKDKELTPLRLLTNQARCRITIKKRIAGAAICFIWTYLVVNWKKVHCTQSVRNLMYFRRLYYENSINFWNCSHVSGRVMFITIETQDVVMEVTEKLFMTWQSNWWHPGCMKSISWFWAARKHVSMPQNSCWSFTPGRRCQTMKRAY